MRLLRFKRHCLFLTVFFFVKFLYVEIYSFCVQLHYFEVYLEFVWNPRQSEKKTRSNMGNSNLIFITSKNHKKKEKRRKIIKELGFGWERWTFSGTHKLIFNWIKKTYHDASLFSLSRSLQIRVRPCFFYSERKSENQCLIRPGLFPFLFPLHSPVYLPYVCRTNFLAIKWNYIDH